MDTATRSSVFLPCPLWMDTSSPGTLPDGSRSKCTVCGIYFCAEKPDASQLFDRLTYCCASSQRPLPKQGRGLQCAVSADVGYRVWEHSTRLWGTISKPLLMAASVLSSYVACSWSLTSTHCVSTGKVRLASLTPFLLCRLQSTASTNFLSTPGVIVCVWHTTQHQAFRKMSVRVSWSTSGHCRQVEHFDEAHTLINHLPPKLPI